MTVAMWRRAPASFWATLALALVAFGAQVMRYRYELIGSEVVHAGLIVALVVAWFVSLVVTLRADRRWGMIALLTAPVALVFIVGVLVLLAACATTGACL